MGRNAGSVQGVAVAIISVLPLLPVPPLHAFQPSPQRDSAAAPQTGTAVIRGRVTLAGGVQPVARASVRASSPTLKTPRAVKTDANGRYEIRDLPSGKYVVSVVKPNFVTAAFGQKRPLGPGAPFDLADGQNAADVNVSIARSGVISGRVLDEVGDPVTDVQVLTMRYQYLNGERRMMPAPGRGATNDVGEFRLFGLPPGDYFVVAAMQNGIFAESDSKGESRSGYASTYYPGTGNPAEAQRISIDAGQVVAGLTMTLLPVRTVHVSGVALDDAGRPMSGANVMTMTTNTMLGSAPAARVGADGKFTVTGLTPGDYVLRAGSFLSGSDAQTATLPITIADSDISDVQLVAYRPSTITGRVVFDPPDGRPQPSTLRIVAARPNPMLGGGGNATAKDDLTFEMKAAPGHAVIRANVAAAGPWQLKSVMLNGVDVTDSGIDVPQNETIPNLVVTMTAGHGELSGTVAGADGQPERDCWVIVFSRDSAKWTPLSRATVATRPGQTNRFQVRVPPGDYYAIAVDNFDVEQGEWTDPTFLARVRDRAVTFSIADGDKKTLDLKVSASPR